VSHDHDEHDDGHADHPPEDPRWVLAPLLVGFVIGIVALVVFGFGAQAPAVS
jgi:hypothetical protein